MAASKSTPRIVDVDATVLARVMEHAESLLSREDFEVVKGLADTLVEMTKLVRERGTTIARLRRLFGLSKSEKTAVVFGSSQSSEQMDPAAQGTAAQTKVDASAGEGDAHPAQGDAAPAHGVNENSAAPAGDGAGEPAKKKGHGRTPASDYVAARRIAVPHERLRHGDPCPACDRGKVYRLKEPAPIVRIVGQAPLVATCWECERMRCGACGKLYTAHAPQEAQGEKYDETAASMIALLRYGGGMPFNRLDHLERDLGTPLPSSTQWDVVNQRVELVRPVYDELVRQAAQGAVLHNDDSYMRVLEYMGKRRAALLKKGLLSDPERTGLFTTAIVSMVASGAIALFFTGRKHAGENLTDVLDRRDGGRAPPILMSDALSRNLPAGHPVIESNCAAHGRRKIVDQADNYPAECQHLLDLIGRVYAVDERCRKLDVSAQERLQIHQQESGPLMEEVRRWMQSQLDERRIEPNSALGDAFDYFLKRWPNFTVFLREPGAPIDNNICERTLKMAIRNRRNSLFYRNDRGAQVGDVYMTLIHTAELHEENPFEYLTALQRHAELVAKTPAQWLPWTYRDTLRRRSAADAAPASEEKAA